MGSHIGGHIEGLKGMHEYYLTTQELADAFRETERYFIIVDGQVEIFRRSAYRLLYLLISDTPPYQDRNSRSEVEEQGEEQEETPQLEPVFENDDLLLDVETDYKVNSLLFQACFTFVKSESLFITEEDMMKHTDELPEHNVTSVLANLAQLLTLVRSFKEDDYECIETVIGFLMSPSFNRLFMLKEQTDFDKYFFVLYPDIAAKLKVFLLLQRALQTEATFKHLKMQLAGDYRIESIATNGECYKNEFNQCIEALKVATEESEFLKEFREKVPLQEEFQKLKSTLLEFLVTHATKIIGQVNSTFEYLGISTPIHKVKHADIFEERRPEQQEDINELLREYSIEFDDLKLRIAKCKAAKRKLAKKFERLCRGNVRYVQELFAVLLTDDSNRVNDFCGMLELDYPYILEQINDSIERVAAPADSRRLSELEKENRELRRLLMIGADPNESKDVDWIVLDDSD